MTETSTQQNTWTGTRVRTTSTGTTVLVITYRVRCTTCTGGHCPARNVGG
jgi:hypothetical protein